MTPLPDKSRLRSAVKPALRRVSPVIHIRSLLGQAAVGADQSVWLMKLIFDTSLENRREIRNRSKVGMNCLCEQYLGPSGPVAAVGPRQQRESAYQI